MPNITDHQSQSTTKIIIEGDSGTGKTGGLCSLAQAGYNVRVLDLDNGLDLVKNLLDPIKGKYGPDAASRFHYVTLTEKQKFSGGKTFPVTAKVWNDALTLMENWKDGEHSFGSVTSWTPKEVLVVDTTTGLGRAAYNHVCGMNGMLINRPTGNARLRALNQAQDLMMDFMEALTSAEIKCNVILNAHIAFQDEPGSVRTEGQEQMLPQQGFPTMLGRAIGPRVPRLFNSILMTKKVGNSYQLITKTNLNINLKTSAPTNVKPTYPIETGLADYFKAVRGET